MTPTPRLTPALAARYVKELSADVRAVVVLGRHGDAVLRADDRAAVAATPGSDPAPSGPDPLAAPARALVDALARDEAEVVLDGGVICAARSRDHAIVAVCGPHVLGALQRHDLRVALADLAPGSGAAPEAATPAPAAIVPSAAARAVPAPAVQAARRLLQAVDAGQIPPTSRTP